jgi:hypothetical protein
MEDQCNDHGGFAMPRIHPEHMTVGKMIEVLSVQEDKTEVYFDFCLVNPTGLSSYRGYYEDVAIGWSEDADSMTAKQLLEAFKAANGKTQQGYKGGTYTVNDDTAVWVANWGRTGDTAVVGTTHTGWSLIINTAQTDD